MYFIQEKGTGQKKGKMKESRISKSLKKMECEREKSKGKRKNSINQGNSNERKENRKKKE